MCLTCICTYVCIQQLHWPVALAPAHVHGRPHPSGPGAVRHAQLQLRDGTTSGGGGFDCATSLSWSQSWSHWRSWSGCGWSRSWSQSWSSCHCCCGCGRGATSGGCCAPGGCGSETATGTGGCCGVVACASGGETSAPRFDCGCGCGAPWNQPCWTTARGQSWAPLPPAPPRQPPCPWPPPSPRWPRHRCSLPSSRWHHPWQATWPRSSRYPCCRRTRTGRATSSPRASLAIGCGWCHACCGCGCRGATTGGCCARGCWTRASRGCCAASCAQPPHALAASVAPHAPPPREPRALAAAAAPRAAAPCAAHRAPRAPPCGANAAPPVPLGRMRRLVCVWGGGRTNNG